ncbi:MAG: mandelate racemase/muconate lactonizing enzyme family protein [Alphaproteobacteria bacterium]|nr:mandelate racemase/muconate lactonizing enzyme family protein [Alphaproteobacteria bacterium]
MKVTEIAVFQVPLTSHVVYYMADGKSCDTVTSVVVRLTTDTGLTGWGEACPIPHYLPAYADGIAPALGELAEVVIGADPVGPEALMARCDGHLMGHGYAKSALDIALWDLTGKAANLPLHALLGGRRTDRLPLYHSITCVAPDEMARMAREAQAAGMRQFQAKLGTDRDWQTDAERLIKIREAVGRGPVLYGDWNCGATTYQATRTGHAVRDHDVMLEQPCKTIAACAEVRRNTGLPMKLDESAHDTASLLEAHRAGCVDVAALKLSKFGGLSALRRARDLCLHLEIMMVIEDTWGSDIATAAALHLAAATPPETVLNVCDLSGYVAPRIDALVPTRNGAWIGVPEGPGLGVSPDEAALGAPVAVFS